MKAIKYLVAGVLALSATLPIGAQDLKSQIEAISKVIIDNGGDLKATKAPVAEFLKTNKKNPTALAGLGYAYFEAKNEEEALKYADLAIKANKNAADGYLLKGDMARAKDDGGEAAMWYQTATQFAPQDPNGYVKYARVYQKVDPDGAVAMLEKLRSVNPGYPVDAAAGYMYSAANKLKSAMQYYDKVQDVSKLEDYILYDYVATAYVTGEYEKSQKLAKKGAELHPDYSSFNRIAFYSSHKLNDNQAALQYADKLFNKKDTLKFIANDYQFYGDVLYDLGRTDDAVKAYKKVQEVAPERTDIYKYISDVYLKSKDYDKALENYNKYLELLGSEANANHYRALADIYVDQIDGANEATKQSLLKKADGVYQDIEQKFDYAADYAAYQRALIHYQMNSDLKKGEAKPYYEKYIELVEPKADKTASDQKKLATSYQYLAVHYIQNDNVQRAKDYAAKVLQYRPDDETATQIINLK